MANYYNYGIEVPELVDRYRVLYSGAVYDVLDGLGLPNQSLASDIKPIRSDMIIAGPAFTVRGFPDLSGNEKLRSERLENFRAMAALRIPLIDVRDCSSDTQVAHYGELNATASAASGAVGALIDGGVRDTGFLLRKNFPVMRRYQNPVEAHMRWSFYERQVEVGLRGELTSMVRIRPGDFVFGDLDGAVVIPREMTVEVLEKTEALVRRENESRAAFEAGEDPLDVYHRLGRL